jgi:Fe-S-cluster containining protein
MPRESLRQRLIRRGESQFAICTRHCGAKCCRYVTVAIASPRGEADWDEVRWWLAHEGIRVGQDSEGWAIEFLTRCRNLEEDGACGIYESRMTICAEHDATDCEFAEKVEYEVLLESETDLADYLERRRLVRGRRVAESIRRAAALRRKRAASPAGRGLVQVKPLDGTT